MKRNSRLDDAQCVGVDGAKDHFTQTNKKGFGEESSGFEARKNFHYFD